MKRIQHSILSILILINIIIVIPKSSCFQIPLPGGRSISYNADSGILRINLEGDNNKIKDNKDTTTITSTSQLLQKLKSSSLLPPFTNQSEISLSILESIQIRYTGIEYKGYGAFATKPIPSGSFLGFYEGTIIQTRELLDDILSKRGDGGDYVMSLDGGLTFIDGYERAQDRSTFSTAHLNHADKGTPSCNCIRVLFTKDDFQKLTSDTSIPFLNPDTTSITTMTKVAFFTSRDIQTEEELCFDYGSNFWKGREYLKC